MPVARGDHTALKAILLRVWRVAASSLGPISAAAAPEAAYDRPVWWHWLSRAMTRKRGNQNWARPIVPSPALATEFELRARQLQLTPDMLYIVGGTAGLVLAKQESGAMFLNGCLRSGASTWIQPSKTPLDHLGAH